jgi:hypothetical protein
MGLQPHSIEDLTVEKKGKDKVKTIEILANACADVGRFQWPFSGFLHGHTYHLATDGFSFLALRAEKKIFPEAPDELVSLVEGCMSGEGHTVRRSVLSPKPGETVSRATKVKVGGLVYNLPRLASLIAHVPARDEVIVRVKPGTTDQPLAVYWRAGIGAPYTIAGIAPCVPGTPFEREISLGGV